MKVLIVSVGGSDKPIIESIKKNAHDFVNFICTKSIGTQKGSREIVDGTGLVCQDRDGGSRPSITVQLGLSPDQYDITTVDSDDLYGIYKTCYELILQHINAGNKVVVDYTGGTKSMSAGLAAAGMDHEECVFSLVKGPRLDLVKVRDGMERVAQLPNRSFVFRQKELSLRLVEQWDYAGASRILDQLDRSGRLLQEDEDTISRLLYLTRGFALWDVFEYRKAAKLIELYKNDETIKPYNQTLKQIVWALDWHENWTPEESRPGPGFLLVYDVLLNAERKVSSGSYDDAISRLYRSVEMYAQFSLRYSEYKLTSDDIDLSRIPADIRDKYGAKYGEDKKITIALTEDYDLLAKLEHPVGLVWIKWRDKMLQVLKKRNHSFLAHGVNPLLQKDYQEVKDYVWAFIQECDQALGNKPNLKQAIQLPTRM